MTRRAGFGRLGYYSDLPFRYPGGSRQLLVATISAVCIVATFARNSLLAGRRRPRLEVNAKAWFPGTILGSGKR